MRPLIRNPISRINGRGFNSSFATRARPLFGRAAKLATAGALFLAIDHCIDKWDVEKHVAVLKEEIFERLSNQISEITTTPSEIAPASVFKNIPDPIAAIVAANLGVAILTHFQPQFLHSFSKSWVTVVRFREFRRLVTAPFTHGGFVHLAFNMFVLVNIGTPICQVLGDRDFTLVRFVPRTTTLSCVPSVLPWFDVGFRCDRPWT